MQHLLDKTCSIKALGLIRIYIGCVEKATGFIKHKLIVLEKTICFIKNYKFYKKQIHTKLYTNAMGFIKRQYCLFVKLYVLQ